MNLAVNGLSLTFAVTLVFVALVISFHEKIGLEKDMIISVFRAIIQLFIVGYLLKFIFHINDVWLTLLMMLIIIFNAAANAKAGGETTQRVSNFIYRNFNKYWGHVRITCFIWGD